MAKRAPSAKFGKKSIPEKTFTDSPATSDASEAGVKESAFSKPVEESIPKSEIMTEIVDKEVSVGNNKKTGKLKGVGGRIVIILLIIAIGASAYSFFLYRQSQEQLKNFKNPQEVSKTEIKQLVDKVGKLIDLPASETPTIATVTDNAKLKNQAFFAKAVNGDKVLIYTQSKKAILYSPSKNKIINVAPINIGPSPTPSGPTGEAPTAAPEATTAPTALPSQ